MQHSIHQGLAPYLSEPSSVTECSRRFIPKTITPIELGSLEERFRESFNELERILGPRAHELHELLSNTRNRLANITEIPNEASLVAFLQERCINDVIVVLQAAVERIAELRKKPDLVDRDAILALPLSQALDSIHLFLIDHERRVNNRFANDLSIAHINNILRKNATLRKQLCALPNKNKVLECNNVKPFSDIEVAYLTKDAELMEFKTGLLFEVKYDSNLTLEDIHSALHVLQEVMLLPESLDSVQDTDVTPLRQLLMLHAKHLSLQSQHVLTAVAQLYHSMVYRRQTYGFLTWGTASVALEIDWNHCTEPGQHVSYRLFSGDPWMASPNWQYDVCDYPPNLVFVTLNTFLLQLKQGLVSDNVIDRFVHDYYHRNEGLASSPVHSDGADDPDDGDFGPPGGASRDGDSDDGDFHDASSNTSDSGDEKVYQMLLDAASEEEKLAVKKFFKPLDPSLGRCRLAQPAELVRYAACLVKMRRSGYGLTLDWLQKLLPVPLLLGPVPAELNLQHALTDQQEYRQIINKVQHNKRKHENESDGDDQNQDQGQHPRPRPHQGQNRD